MRRKNERRGKNIKKDKENEESGEKTHRRNQRQKNIHAEREQSIFLV